MISDDEFYTFKLRAMFGRHIYHSPCNITCENCVHFHIQYGYDANDELCDEEAECDEMRFDELWNGDPVAQAERCPAWSTVVWRKKLEAWMANISGA